MITRHPYQAVGAVLGVLAVSLFVSSMIGQFNDGPWGGLPSWLGTTTYAAAVIAAVALVLLTVYLIALNARTRRGVR